MAGPVERRMLAGVSAARMVRTDASGVLESRARRAGALFGQSEPLRQLIRLHVDYRLQRLAADLAAQRWRPG